MEYGCQESITRLVHQPHIFIYTCSYSPLARIAARISPRRSFIFTPKIRHFKNFEPNSFVSYLVFLTFQGIISLSPFIDRDDFANPKCWKSSCRDLRIIATFSNQPILNSRKERRKEREKRNSTGIVGRGTIGRANRGRKAPGSRELFAARLSGHREERRSRGKYGSRRWSIEQHTELVT